MEGRDYINWAGKAILIVVHREAGEYFQRRYRKEAAQFRHRQQE